MNYILKTYLIFGMLFTVFTADACGDFCRISGTIEGLTGDATPVIVQYTGETVEPIAYGQYVPETKGFRIEVDAHERGVYELQFGLEYTTPIILSHESERVELNLNAKDLYTENWIPQFDDENIALSKFNWAFKQLNDRKAYIQQEVKALKQVGDVQSRKRINTLINEYDNLHVIFNDELNKISTDYPESYVADVLAPMMLTPFPEDKTGISYKEYMAKNFFMSWDFSNQELLNNPFLVTRLDEYMKRFVNKDDDGFELASDNLMEMAYANKDVKHFMLNYLINTFIDFGPENMVTYVYDTYGEECTDNDAQVTDITKKRIEAIRNFQVGIQVPDFNQEKTTGESVVLYEELKDNPVLLFFWSSTCHSCEKITPAIKQIAKDYGDELSIITIALDKDREQWESAIASHGMEEWTNLSELKGYGGDISKSFFVHATPSLFLIGQDGKLISKDTRTKELRKHIDLLIPVQSSTEN